MVPFMRLRDSLLQQFNGVCFYQDVAEIFNLVAGTAGVTVNALVLAAPVQVHIVFQAKPFIRLADCVQEHLGCDFFNHLDLGWDRIVKRCALGQRRESKFTRSSSQSFRGGSTWRVCLQPGLEK